MKGRLARAVGVALLLTALLAGTAHAAGARVIRERKLEGRAIELTISTSAFSSPTKVQVDLPVGYDADRSRRWPVTYVLAGTMNSEASFNNFIDGQRLSAGYPSIIVSPDSNSGYWSDWYNGGAFGPPEYETFVIDQLIPLIDGRLRTRPDRAHRAVFGISMGGYGAMMFAARHPDVFAAAASLSGAVDSNLPTLGAALTASSTFDGGPPDAINGPRSTEEIRWRGRNPTDLAPNLRPVNLQVRTANGVPNPAIGEGRGSGDVPSCVVEGGVHMGSVSLHRRLAALGIPHLWRDYGAGCHTPPNFEREVTDTLAVFERVLAHPPRPPARVDYRSIEPSYGVWGWRVSVRRPALEFGRLSGADRSGFALTGSGTATVTTPRRYRPYAPYAVTVGATTRPARVDPAGRLGIRVPLGPGNPGQEYRPGVRTASFTKRVVIASRDACLARRSPLGRGSVGRVRLGRGRTALRRLAGLRRRTRHSLRFCVKGGGRVVATLSRRGRSALVLSTARGHGNRGVRPGRPTRVLRRAYPHRVRLTRGVYRAGRGSRTLVGVRRGRIRFVGVASTAISHRVRELRRQLRYAR